MTCPRPRRLAAIWANGAARRDGSPLLLGYAPSSGQWLIGRAVQNQVSLELLEKVGLDRAATHGDGFYDRFRDRVQFPDPRRPRQPVGLAGAWCPARRWRARLKYYNSARHTAVLQE
ncbi:MAG: hypothetical protein U0736_10825 [Gemmataceae bacterium]